MRRLAIITTHPIQYNAPFFKKLSESGQVQLKVFYTWDKGTGAKHDPGFGKKIEWDIPLLEGYEYTFVKNTSKKPGSNQFFGIKNPTLINEITTFQPHAILVYGWCFQSHLQVLRHFKNKIPVWFRGDSHLLDETPGFKTLLRRIFLKWVYKHVDKAFYVGINNKAYYLAHGLKEQQLVLMPHVVDNDFFSRESEAREKEALDWRKSIGIAADDFVVLFAGKFESKKDPGLLIHAILELKKEMMPGSQHHQFSNLNIQLIMLGNGVLESHLKKLADQQENIHFIPFQNQSKMPIVYRLADVYCLPSKGPGETWGLAVNEALACGRPVIVSDKVGCAIDLVSSDTGLVFMSDNIESLSNTIINLCASVHKFNRLKIYNHIQKWGFESLCNAITKTIK